MSRAATFAACAILDLREGHRSAGWSPSALRLVELLYEHPVVTVRRAAAVLQSSYATANNAVSELERAGVLVEVTGNQRNRRYRFDAYIRVFDDVLGVLAAGTGMTVDREGMRG